MTPGYWYSTLSLERDSVVKKVYLGDMVYYVVYSNTFKLTAKNCIVRVNPQIIFLIGCAKTSGICIVLKIYLTIENNIITYSSEYNIEL